MTPPFFEMHYNKSFISLFSYISLIFFSTLAGVLLMHTIGVEEVLNAQALIRATPSFGVLFIVAFFPLVFTFLLFRWNCKLLLHILIAIKSVVFTFSFSAIIAIFVNSGWLMLLLIFFSGCAGICVYHWLWMQILVFDSRHGRRNFLICSSVLLVIILIDHYFVSPFTASLFIH